jgi:hypothetical protein
MTLQLELYRETRDCGWEPLLANSLPEELMHLVAEITEAFEDWRRNKHCEIWYEDSGKPRGIPIEFADVLIGLFYNAEAQGFDLFEALEIKRQWNLGRRYDIEGRQLH